MSTKDCDASSILLQRLRLNNEFKLLRNPVDYTPEVALVNKSKMRIFT
ncbi:hypothetical protein [Nostoc sp.]